MLLNKKVSLFQNIILRINIFEVQYWIQFSYTFFWLVKVCIENTFPLR